MATAGSRTHKGASASNNSFEAGKGSQRGNSVPGKPMSIARLAQHLGLSEGTVSRALNNYPDISITTRDRVSKAAKELGYRPSSAARRLARGVVETIGFVLPSRKGHLSDPFLAEILDGVAAELAEHDWDLLVSAVPENQDGVHVMERLVSAGKVSGFVLTRTRRHDRRVEFLRQASVPFVVHGRTETANDYSWLDIDNEKAFVDIVHYLANLGHTRIALLGGDVEMNFAWQRRTGFLGAIAKLGLDRDDALVIDNVTGGLEGRAAAQRLLALPSPPTAIVAVTDAVAIGAMQAVQSHGLQVGRDISVIGYDGLPMGATVEPALTTMSQPSYEAGREVGRMVLAQASSKTPKISQTLWEATLTLRASCGPVHHGHSPSGGRDTDRTAAAPDQSQPAPSPVAPSTGRTK